MDDGGNGRHKMDFYKGVHTPWNMMPQYQMKDSNAFFMNKKIMHIFAEKDAAIEEMNRAIADKNAAIEERNGAFKQRDEAIAARDTAIRERDSAIAALRFQENSMNGTFGGYEVQRGGGTKRAHQEAAAYNGREVALIEAFPLAAVSSDAKPRKKIKENNNNNSKSISSRVSKPGKKGKRVGEDLNRQVTTDGSKAEWDAQDLSLVSEVNFDESTMAPPVCSCTGVARQCYKWGSGGWQSACCTNTLSEYPLPQMANRRHARMGGRKMSGSVFTRLLSRLAADGHDLSMPLDLKNFWCKHGTNRYITIK